MFPLATQLIYKSLKWPWNHILIQRSKNFGLRGGGWEEGLFLLYLSPVLINFAIKIQFLIYVILFFKFYLLVKRQRNIKVLVYILCIQKHPQSKKQHHGTLYREIIRVPWLPLYIMVIILSLSIHYIPSVFLLYLSLLGLKFTNTRGMLYHYSSINS